MTSSGCTTAVESRAQLSGVLVAITMALACCTALPARSDSLSDSATKSAETSAKVSRDQATQIALQALPGKVTDVTVERKRGKVVYVIEIVAQKDGAETDVLIDMQSGAIIGMDR